MATATLQPDAAAGLDTFISPRAATTNFGTDTKVVVGELNDDVGSSGDRTLIKFDLSSIPSTATISSAVLSLFATEDHATNARTFRVYRQKRAWVEAQATWNIFATSNNWQTAGAFGANDCEQTDIGSRAFTATETLNQFKDFTLTASAVQAWVSGAFANNGLLIKADTESNDAYYFASSDHATAANRPKLVVVYKVTSSIAGSSSGSGTAVGTLRGKSGLTATIAGVAIADALASGIGYLEAVSAGVATGVALLVAKGYLEGDSSGSAVVVGRSSLDASLEGESLAIGNVSGTLLATGYVEGQSTSSIVVAGLLRSKASVLGLGSGNSFVVGVILALGRLTGSSTGLGSAAGDLADEPAVESDNDDTFKQMYVGMFRAMR